MLAAVGVYTLIDARGLNVGFGDPVGPRVFPYAIGLGMILLAVGLAVATSRGDVGEAEAGEDIDPTSPGRLGDGGQAGRASWCSTCCW